ncbi:uncharacterized protein F5891DRAFT_1188858 [Suillus fuscotomentosus]|uniref:DUF6532 domain-containing protein n=1 Tax=Suillus fuscotomentosus TaxID=1912939 RepID=A0AAD4HJP6_9AGAM|nr:uncharacterized protein F5891DRAFT_1188858 [Suillus fuscotomentosus]KAG1900165.1 hypothetical protein F5891DRAFT_1188858 [Suillus fuscotomentosus]
MSGDHLLLRELGNFDLLPPLSTVDPKNKTRETEKDSPDRDELEYDAYDNDMQDDEDLFRNPDDSYQQHRQDDEQDHKQDNKQDNDQDNKQDDDQDDQQDDDKDDDQDKYEQEDHEQDKRSERYSMEDLQTGRYDDDDLMESDQNQGEDSQADNECINSGVFDVLEWHQVKNGWRKAPSPSHLSSSFRRHSCLCSCSKSPHQYTNKHASHRRSIESICAPSTHVKHLVLLLLAPSLCIQTFPVLPPVDFLPRQRSPTQSTLVNGSKSPRSSISCTSTSHTQPPSHGHSLSKAPPSHVACLAPNEGDQPKHQVERTSKQANPSKLGFYLTCWQTFLQAAKLEMCLQAVLMDPIPEHCDAVGLTQEVLDAELWKYHSKKIGLENGYFPEYRDQMSHLLCDDLFTFQTELKKVIISIVKQLYNIFPRSSVMHGDSVQKCVTEAASKLIRSGDYLQLPDSSKVQELRIASS